MASSNNAWWAAWRLYRSDNQRDTYLALALLALLSAPYALKYLRERNGGGRR
jgi:hypothetical protein